MTKNKTQVVVFLNMQDKSYRSLHSVVLSAAFPDVVTGEYIKFKLCMSLFNNLNCPTWTPLRGQTQPVVHSQLAWKVICRYCLVLVWSWATSIDWVFFFLPPSLSSLYRSQLSTLPQHSKLVCFVAYCAFSHTCSLTLSLAPVPIPPTQSWQTSQAYKPVASGTARMQ